MTLEIEATVPEGVPRERGPDGDREQPHLEVHFAWIRKGVATANASYSCGMVKWFGLRWLMRNVAVTTPRPPRSRHLCRSSPVPAHVPSCGQSPRAPRRRRRPASTSSCRSADRGHAEIDRVAAGRPAGARHLPRQSNPGGGYRADGEAGHLARCQCRRAAVASSMVSPSTKF